MGSSSILTTFGYILICVVAIMAIKELFQIILLWINKNKDIAICYKPFFGYLSLLVPQDKGVDGYPCTYFDELVEKNEDKKAILLNNPVGFVSKFWVLHNPETYKSFFLVENEVSKRMSTKSSNRTILNYLHDDERGQ